MTDRRAEIQAVIRDTRSLPTIPPIIGKLNAMSASNKSSIQEMARVVSSDQVLSARVLRLANSPSYGFYRVSTISNAMIFLGVDVVKSLALSSSILELMENSVVGLWEHSLGAGVAANIIARRIGLPDCEEISTAALLHDIGKVILKIKFPKEYDEVLAMTATGAVSFATAEMELFGVDHAEVGGWLAKNWFLPDKLIEPITCHHNVENADNHRTRASVVHLADVLVKAGGIGFSGEEFVPDVHDDAWDTLALNEITRQDIIAELEDKKYEIQNFSLELQSSETV